MNASSDRCSRNILILTLCSDKQLLLSRNLSEIQEVTGKEELLEGMRILRNQMCVMETLSLL